MKFVELMQFRNFAQKALDRFFPEPKQEPVETKSLVWPTDWLSFSSTVSGIDVTPISAMKVPAVAAAVNLISGAAELPAKIYKRDEDGKEEDRDHPAFPLVHRFANDRVSAASLRDALTRDALLRGNGYAVANRLGDGRIAEFIRLPPGAVSVEINDLGEPRYRVTTGNGGQRFYQWRDMLHVPAPMLAEDGVTGIAPITLAREAIGLLLTMEQHAARLFANGARPSSVLLRPAGAPALPPEAALTLVQSFSAATSGANAGKTPLLDEGTTFEPFGFSSVDAQFLELREFQIQEVSRAFTVPVTFLGSLDRATWSNSEQMDLQLLKYTVLPWLRTWQEAYERVLLTPPGYARLAPTTH